MRRWTGHFRVALCVAIVALFATISVLLPACPTVRDTPSRPHSDSLRPDPLAWTWASIIPAQMPPYNVTFSESGLPPGAVWSLDFNGTVNFTSKPSIVYLVGNGSYPFWVGPAVGDGSTYVASPSSSVMHVTGAPKSRTLFFQPVPLPPQWKVTFVESGLPSGTAWSVTLNGSTSFSASTSLIVPISNGSYEYGIPSVGTYLASPGFGPVTMRGMNLTIAVKFTTPTVLGIAPAEGFAVISIGLTLSLLLFGIIVLLFRQRRKRQELRREQQTVVPTPSRSSSPPRAADSPDSPPARSQPPGPPPG